MVATVEAPTRRHILLAADHEYDVGRTRMARRSSCRFIRRADDPPPAVAHDAGHEHH
jgi:hypothetical protein